MDYASPKFLAPHGYTRPLRKTERRESKRCRVGCIRWHADSPGLKHSAQVLRHAISDTLSSISVICNSRTELPLRGAQKSKKRLRPPASLAHRDRCRM